MRLRDLRKQIADFGAGRAARLYGRSEATIRRWVREGAPKGVELKEPRAKKPVVKKPRVKKPVAKKAKKASKLKRFTAAELKSAVARVRKRDKVAAQKKIVRAREKATRQTVEKIEKRAARETEKAVKKARRETKLEVEAARKVREAAERRKNMPIWEVIDEIRAKGLSNGVLEAELRAVAKRFGQSLREVYSQYHSPSFGKKGRRAA